MPPAQLYQSFVRVPTATRRLGSRLVLDFDMQVVERTVLWACGSTLVERIDALISLLKGFVCKVSQERDTDLESAQFDSCVICPDKVCQV